MNLKDVEDIIRTESHLVLTDPTRKYLNPNTDWTDANIYFGMGGGSQELTKGLPLDILGLVFTGELLKQKMELKKASILVADVITKTNPFPESDIDRVCKGEQEIMQYLLDLFGFDGWDVILHSDLHIAGAHPGYTSFLEDTCANIDEAIKRSPFSELGKDARGHKDNYHFALECALTHYLVGNGIHLGWYIPGPDIQTSKQVTQLISRFGKAGLKRMDEEPFDSYYIELMKVLGEEDKITPVYAKAAFRITAVKNEVERVPPYICYQPQNRILLIDNECVTDKLTDTSGRLVIPKRGKAKEYYRDILRLAKLFKVPLDGNSFLDGIHALLDYINRDGELKRIYQKTFKPGFSIYP